MPPPDPATLTRWAAAWEAERRAAYRALVASYTDEQRAIIARMAEAKRQARLCRARRRWPEGSTSKHSTLVVWPDAPPGDGRAE